MRIDTQPELDNPEYTAFVEKFKPKKTTDDCYTPDNIFKVVTDYVTDRYGIPLERMMRPFWPGKDYRKVDYPEGCCVVDNPPFSIETQIVNDYMNAGISFFLFCPYLTAAGLSRGRGDVCRIIAPENVVYANGAEIATGFVTNLEPGMVMRTDTELAQRLKVENLKNLAGIRKRQRKIELPAEIMTAARMGYLCNHGVDFALKAADCGFIRKLDAGVDIFGGGQLMSRKATEAYRAAQAAVQVAAQAEVYELSEREWKMVEALG